MGQSVVFGAPAPRPALNERERIDLEILADVVRVLNRDYASVPPCPAKRDVRRKRPALQWKSDFVQAPFEVREQALESFSLTPDKCGDDPHRPARGEVTEAVDAKLHWRRQFDGGKGLADAHHLVVRNLAKELQRNVEILRFDPRYRVSKLWRRLKSLPSQAPQFLADAFRQLDGRKQSHGVRNS